jgi:hypothetical protein
MERSAGINRPSAYKKRRRRTRSRYRSHRLLHFWNASWKPFSVRVSTTLYDPAWISSMVSNRRPFRFNFIFGNRKRSQGAKSGE